MKRIFKIICRNYENSSCYFSDCYEIVSDEYAKDWIRMSFSLLLMLSEEFIGNITVWSSSLFFVTDRLPYRAWGILIITVIHMKVQAKGQECMMP